MDRSETWNEWGHQNNGRIIAVPCARCNVHHDPEECGTGVVCITNITPEEVFSHGNEARVTAHDCRSFITASNTSSGEILTIQAKSLPHSSVS
jgi:hypothetical protein